MDRGGNRRMKPGRSGSSPVIARLFSSGRIGALPCACPLSAWRFGRQFERGRDVRASAGGFFGRGENPSVESMRDAAALEWILDHHKSDEITSGDMTCAHGILVRQHAIEDQGHVIGVKHEPQEL